MCCLEVTQTILPHLLRIYPFQRKQNPLRCVNTVLQMCSHKCWSERKNYFLQPAGCALAHIVQKAVAFLCTRTLRSFPARLLAGEPDCSMYWCIGLLSPKTRFDISLRWTSWGFNQPITPVFWIVALPSILLTAPLILSHLQIYCVFYPIYQVINKHVKLVLAPVVSLLTNDWLPAMLCTADHKPLSLVVQTRFHLHSNPLIQIVIGAAAKVPFQ